MPQFNPYALAKPAINDLERSCINLDAGQPITNINDPALKQHKFYVDCRIQFEDANFIAGYCEGKRVPYVLVRWCSSGFHHSQPATLEYLKTMGAKL